MGEDDKTPVEPPVRGRLTSAIENIAELRAEVEAHDSDKAQVEQVKVKTRSETVRTIVEICARPRVLWPALAAIVLAIGICAGVATGTFSFDMFIDKAVEAVPSAATMGE